jgi:adenylate cyclase
VRLRGTARRLLLLAVGCAVGAGLFHGENFLERAFIDLRFFIAAHARAQESFSDGIAVVLMDRASEARLAVPYGVKWRQFDPAFIRQLDAAGASLVVFDSVFFDQDPERDPPLAAAVRASGRVITGEDSKDHTTPTLRSSFLGIGDLNITPLGGVPRLIRTIPTEEGLLPLSVLCVNERARLAGLALPPGDLRPRLWIDFREPLSWFPSFSYADVLNPRDGRVVDLGSGSPMPLSVFAGRIVFVGRDEGDPSRNDRFPFPSALGKLAPGVYGHAYAADMLLRGRTITRTAWWVDALCTAALLTLLLLVLEVSSRSLRAVALTLLPFAAFAVCQVLLSGPGLWLGYAPLLAGFLSALLAHWTLVRISLAASLDRAMGFDARLIDAFRREGEQRGGTVRRDVSILIADVREYTRYVSRTDPATVSLVMTEYMEAMERCITARGGYINKYVGDEIIAVFGFPLEQARGAERAVRAGMAILEELARLTESWRGRGIASISRIGVGIDTGTVTFVEVGGRTRSQFDIIGDCINGASRIEHLTKELRRTLLVSEEIVRAIDSDDSLAGLFELVKSAAVRGQGERRVFGLLR